MRVISGSLKGRKFSIPSKFPVRPTTDFAREGLFNFLVNTFDLEDVKMLDLFTGTGSISVESWSRGCRDITAVDQHAGCIRYLNKLKAELKLEGLKVIRSEAKEFIKRNAEKYDLIFADPPFAFGGYEEVLTLIMNANMLTEEAMLILEHDKHTNLSAQPGFISEKKYGNVRFSIFEF